MFFGKKAEAEEQQQPRKGIGRTGFVIGAECIYVLLGAVLLFIPQIQMIHICYALGVLLVIVGIIQIVRYFMAESYRNINAYGFSLGVLEVILGICALVRVEAVVSSFLLVLGIGLLLTGVIKLQYAMDLRSMRDPVWIAVVVLAAALVGGAVCVIVNPFADETILRTVTYYLLLIDGLLGIVGSVYLFIRVKLYSRSEQKGGKRQEEEKSKPRDREMEKAPEPVAAQILEPGEIVPAVPEPEENEPVGDSLPNASSGGAAEVDDWLNDIPKADEI